MLSIDWYAFLNAHKYDKISAWKQYDLVAKEIYVNLSYSWTVLPESKINIVLASLGECASDN